MRVRSRFAVLAVVVGLSVAMAPVAPASAMTLPLGCSITAGKIAAVTSTSTRSVDVHVFGWSCHNPDRPVRRDVVVSSLVGGKWVVESRLPVVTATAVIDPLPPTRMHCEHRALTRVGVEYSTYNGSSGERYWISPTTVCS